MVLVVCLIVWSYCLIVWFDCLCMLQRESEGIDGRSAKDKREFELSTKTPNEVANMLASPDVQVTNAKDKEALLPVVRRINDHVREVLLNA